MLKLKLRMKHDGRILAGIILIMTSPLVMEGCKTKSLPGQYAQQGINVDGRSAEWSTLQLTHFEDKGFSLGIANDTNRLYLMMRTHDGGIVRTIRMTGMQLWLNSKGDKETGFGVRFRGGPSFGMTAIPRLPNAMTPPNVNQTDRQIMNERQPLIDTALMFTFIDERQLIDLDIPPDGSLGPAIAIDTSEGFYTYEFSIPLQKSEVRFFGLGASAEREIAVGVKWGEIDRKELSERIGGFQGGIDGQGPPMGGMRGGGPGGGAPAGLGKRPEFRKVDLWVKTTLVNH